MKDIDSTYVRESINDFFVVKLLPCPTINPVNIGIMGNTHGVKASNNPAMKNKNILKTKLFSTSCSLIEN